MPLTVYLSQPFDHLHEADMFRSIAGGLQGSVKIFL
jgi:hypothetical protein